MLVNETDTTRWGCFPPGTAVTVRNRFTDGWSNGFVVEEVDLRSPAGYRLRRLSDNTVLPAWFPAEDVRTR